jgi:hypothetical protein
MCFLKHWTVGKIMKLSNLAVFYHRQICFGLMHFIYRVRMLNITKRWF